MKLDTQDLWKHHLFTSSVKYFCLPALFSFLFLDQSHNGFVNFIILPKVPLLGFVDLYHFFLSLPLISFLLFKISILPVLSSEFICYFFLNVQFLNFI